MFLALFALFGLIISVLELIGILEKIKNEKVMSENSSRAANHSSGKVVHMDEYRERKLFEKMIKEKQGDRIA